MDENGPATSTHEQSRRQASFLPLESGPPQPKYDTMAGFLHCFRMSISALISAVVSLLARSSVLIACVCWPSVIGRAQGTGHSESESNADTGTQDSEV